MLYVLLLLLLPAHASAATCYPPVQGDSQYAAKLVSYNQCVSDENRSICENRTNATTTYYWAATTSSCGYSCVNHAYKATGGDCVFQSGYLRSLEVPVAAEPETVVATPAPIAPAPVIRTVYVPVPTPEKEPVVIVREAPAVPVPAPAPVQKALPLPWWKQVLSWFGWL